MVRTKARSFLTRLYTQVSIRNARMKSGGKMYVYRESKTTSPSSVSIQRTCFRGQTIPRFPHDGPCEQCYGFLTDLEETATVESCPAFDHLQRNLSHYPQY